MKYRDLVHQADPPGDFAHLEQLLIASGDLQTVLSERLTRKTPAQQAQVEQYLTGFAGRYRGMKERMGEFVATFPLHPSCVAVLQRIPFIEQRDILRTLAGALEKLQDQTVPVDYPGLVSYDSFWNSLSNPNEFRSVLELEAVANRSKALEQKIGRSLTPPEHRPLARRLVHALSVHRLTTRDIYSKEGPTAAELCESLCLYHPDLAGKESKPAETLLSLVITVLDAMRHVAGGQHIACDPKTGRYWLPLPAFKRFVRPELILHWVNAVPFVLLILTGSLMLASRFWHLDRSWFCLIRIVHLVTAMVWVVGLPLTVALQFKVHWLHLSTMLSWGRDDLLWVAQSIRSLYNKQAVVGAVGRFNTGQKINACLVMAYFLGFAATGIFMFWKGSILFPWFVHAGLFFAALASVGGHLYLSIFNPGTRSSLPGIFHGWAPVEYVRHHHPLSLPQSLRSPGEGSKPGADASASKVEILMLVAVLLLACLGVTVGVLAYQKGQLASAKRVFAKNFSDLISPNELSTKHRLGATAESCTKCHLYTGEIPDANCEQCHADIKQRRAMAVGYHGTFKDQCVSCHKEHPVASKSVIPLDREKFNHDLADYKLLDKHAKVQCDECHKQKRAKEMTGIYYTGLKYGACTDCHPDMHGGQFAAACEKCHSTRGWTGADVKFAHNTDSTYKLDGKHQQVECVKCHEPRTPGASLGKAVFKGLTNECVGCHQDLHRNQFTAACTSCHSPAGWQKEALRFVHNQDSKYLLLGKHAEVACAKCHLPTRPGEPLGLAQFRGLKTDCVDCHKDPHRGQLSLDCTKCHNTVAWTLKQVRFNHNQESRYALSGKHASVDCIKCHKPELAGGPLGSAPFKGLDTGCADCHKVKHHKHYGPLCVSCHTTDLWPKKAPGVDHFQKYKFSREPLIGKHLEIECRACHKDSSIAAVGQSTRSEYQCATCHNLDDPHKGILGIDCAKCHRQQGWKGNFLRFDHNTMSRYPLDQDHRKVACVKCHEKNVWKPLNPACASCHPNRF